VIYSNWATSRKSEDVRVIQASLTFWWHEQERQVRVEGPVERLKDEESQVYYDTRIRGSRIGAWASAQLGVAGREELEMRVEEVEKRFKGRISSGAGLLGRHEGPAGEGGVLAGQGEQTAR
jgi:pyridoxamine 5'-phosphate oxidase